MLIRTSQIEAACHEAEASFQRRASAYCWKKYPRFSDVLPQEIVAEMVKKGIERGRTHGLTWESSLVNFLELMFSIAPNFDEHPAISAILESPEGSAEERLAAVTGRTSYDTWKEAAGAYDPMSWGIDPIEAVEILDLRGPSLS